MKSFQLISFILHATRMGLMTRPAVCRQIFLREQECVAGEMSCRLEEKGLDGALSICCVIYIQGPKRSHLTCI